MHICTYCMDTTWLWARSGKGKKSGVNAAWSSINSYVAVFALTVWKQIFCLRPLPEEQFWLLGVLSLPELLGLLPISRQYILKLSFLPRASLPFPKALILRNYTDIVCLLGNNENHHFPLRGDDRQRRGPVPLYVRFGWIQSGHNVRFMLLSNTSINTKCWFWSNHRSP